MTTLRPAVTPARQAMTLLELMIAMGLGLVILSAVYTGVQFTIASMTQAEQLSLENRLLAAGIYLALDETDTWAALDNSAAGHTPLRTTPSKTIDPWSGGYATDGTDWQQLAQPFTSLATAWAAGSAELDHDRSLSDPAWWLPHDPRTWYRGDGGLYFYSDDHRLDESAFGNYGIFTNTATAGILVGSSHGGAGWDSAVDLLGATVAEMEEGAWLPNQHAGLKDALGWYGWFDYLPANALVDYYSTDSSRRACKPWELRNLPDGKNAATVVAMDRHGALVRQHYVAPGDATDISAPVLRSGAERAVTPGWYLFTSHIGISGPTSDMALGSDEARQAAVVNRYMGVGYQNDSDFINTFPVLLGALNNEETIVDPRPDNWPQTQVGVRRFKKWGSNTNYCTVRMVDPVTGDQRELSFPAVGTTLRGARRSRSLDP